ncbi:MAG: hypothetical protein A3H96_04300 [Acidobacteria bacterium RIFCSPLOWO2_02_FULL_67_36]|nr:MAG: hypothetical protein A3H96_04300 [Acidobacteria bacterium RIFCSPLOWO2_02_FULL_67_36]OFW26332.1 MAG: hypothetical protein A3G21_26945 [Acidobacteria bacterium RIFCSPLOWO2_12_FULL_66_21]
MAKKTAPVAAPAPVTAPVVATNHTLTYRRLHPQGRASYGIAGVPGLVGFHLSMFADGKAPATITVDCALALPVTKAAKVTVAA